MKKEISYRFLPLIFVVLAVMLPKVLSNLIVYNVSNPNQIYFLVNRTTGRVGIGVVNPTYPFEVGVTSKFTNAYFDDVICNGCINASDIALIQCPSGFAIASLGGGSFACVQINSTPGVVNGSGSVNYIPIWIGTNTLGNSIIYQSSGNVGIGTTSPSQKLTVAGNIGIQAGADAFIGTLDNYALSLRTNNADRIFITNAGNVGIGTTSPGAKLAVIGDLAVGSNNVDNAQGWNRVLTVQGGAHAKLLVTETTAGVKTGIFSHSNWNGVVGRIGTESNHDLRLMAGYGNDVMTLTTSGNVGIGTTNPAYRLDVAGDIRATATVITDTVTPNSAYVKAAGSNLLTMTPYVDNALGFRTPYKVEKWDGSTWVDITNSATWGYLTDGKPSTALALINFNYTATKSRIRLYYDFGGSWITPAQQLVLYMQHLDYVNYLKVEHADDNAFTSGVATLKEITSQISCGDCTLIVPTNTFWKRYLRIEIETERPAGNEMYLREIAYYSPAYWSSSKLIGSMIPMDWDYNKNVFFSGNVGIGTTSPTQKLDVAGNVNASAYYDRDNSAYYIDPASTSNLNIIQLNDANTKILKGSNNAVRIQTNSGYVDIGPQNTGYTHFVTDRPAFWFNQQIQISGGVIAAYLSPMYLQAPQGTTRIYIDNSTGNVGIGTTSPVKKLDVVGDINATGNVYGSALCIGSDCKTSWSQVVGGAGPWDNSTTQVFVRDGYPFVVNASNVILNRSSIILIPTSQTPLATNGAIYYDATLNKFRCFQNGKWIDCITTVTGANDGFWNLTGNLLYPRDLSFNVGIGTNVPSEKLEVQGRILVASSNPFELEPSDSILDVKGSINATATIYGQTIYSIGDIRVGGNNIQNSTGTNRITFNAGYILFNDDIRVGGNNIQNSTGTNRITFNAGYILFNDDIRVGGNNIQDSGGTNRITLGDTTTINASLLNITGNLRVNGNNIQDSGGTNRITLGSTTTITANLNLASGYNLQIAGVTVLDSNRNIINTNWINSTNFNASNLICLGGICKNTWPSSSLAGGSGSNGQVAFWISSDTLSGDNNLYWDNSNKRLGIGTNVPSEKLEVQGRILVASSNPFELEPSDGILDVKGSINATVVIFVPKSSTAPFACDSSKAGAIFYNISNNKFYGCNSTNWVIIGG